MNFYRVNIKIWDLRFETFAVSRKRVYKSLFWFSQALSSDEGTFAYKILSKLEKILVILFFCRPFVTDMFILKIINGFSTGLLDVARRTYTEIVDDITGESRY